MKCAACGFDDAELFKQDSFQELDLCIGAIGEEESVDVCCEVFKDRSFKTEYMTLYRCPKCGTVRAE